MKEVEVKGGAFASAHCATCSKAQLCPEPPVFYLSRERPDQTIKAANPTVKIYGSGTAARLMLLEEETSPV